MKLSIVIATHNRAALLERVVEATLAQTLPPDRFELILVDDGSTDGTETLGAELGQRRGVRYIRQPNRGVAAARNRGIAQATGEVVAFTDDDCLVPPDWLERLADGYARHPEVVGVGGRLVAPPDALRARAVARLEAHVARCVYGAGDEEALGGFECPAGGTNNMSYRRAALLEVGGFDEGFPPLVWGEDADLKRRLTQRGGRLLYVPVAVLHLRDYGLGSFLRQSWQRGRGEAHFRLKHEGRRGAPAHLKRLCLAPLKLAAAPLRRDPAMRAAAALGDLALAAGCLTYRCRKRA
ncbi:MAG TPA: glycosyltransferase [Planctomycetota bacterium]|nr:glycosyltransferase [Planctomycetota bacterium]HRR79192.1 glycosyltransferase [Planctomycetota bacterium]HRT97044.1 glycosyltransferase [Planctomycetota bacterium]